MRTIKVFAVVVLAVGVVAGCGSSEGNGKAAPTSPTVAPATSSPPAGPATATAPPATTTAPPLTGGMTSASPAPTIPAGAAAACTGAAITPVLAAAFDIPGTLTIVDTQIAQCRNGYARVLAVPRESNQEHEQVFLRAEGGRWRIIDSGSGISCTDPDLRPQVIAACVALGLR